MNTKPTLDTHTVSHPTSMVLSRALGILAWVLFLFLSAGSMPPTAAAMEQLSVESLRNADGSLKPTRQTGGSVDLKGWEVTLDARRGPVAAQTNPAAEPNAAKWSPLSHQGLNANRYVTALVVSGTDIYVAGRFDETFDGKVTGLNNIAKYDTLTNKWSPLAHGGLDFRVQSLLLDGTTLYVGGTFAKTFDGVVTNLNKIATYNISTHTWGKLTHSGLNGNIVNTLALHNGILYVGGDFSKTYDDSVSNLNFIAAYNTATKVWSPMPNNGLNNFVSALAVVGANVYVGGPFTSTYGSAANDLRAIAKYNPKTQNWVALAAGLNSSVEAMTVINKTLYVGGQFTQTSGNTVLAVKYIARYQTKTGTWSALSGMGLNDAVFALANDGTNLYVGGGFSKTYDTLVPDLNRVAKYNATTNTWSKLPHKGLDGITRAWAISGATVYVGGDFTKTYDGLVATLHSIARLQ